MKKNSICKIFVLGTLLCSVSLSAQKVSDKLPVVRSNDGVGDDSLSRILATRFSA